MLSRGYHVAPRALRSSIEKEGVSNTVADQLRYRGPGFAPGNERNFVWSELEPAKTFAVFSFEEREETAYDIWELDLEGLDVGVDTHFGSGTDSNGYDFAGDAGGQTAYVVRDRVPADRVRLAAELSDDELRERSTDARRS